MRIFKKKTKKKNKLIKEEEVGSIYRLQDEVLDSAE